MSSFAKSLLRDMVQKLLGIVFAWIGVHFLAVPQDVKDPVTNWAVLVITALLMLLWTAFVRWLESAHGVSAVDVYRRALGRIFMLGIATTPVYVTPPKPQPVVLPIPDAPLAPTAVTAAHDPQPPVPPTTTVGPDGSPLH